MTAAPAPEGAAESITRDELALALRGLKITPEDENTFYPAVADAILERVRRNREPEYEPYEIYEGGNGRRWEFYSDGDGQRGWLATGEVTRYGFSYPARPLRKLVPLPSAAEIEEMLATEPAWIGGRQIAEAVVRLLEGGSGD